MVRLGRRTSTALLLINAYNDFLSEGGVFWPSVRETAQAVGLHGHLLELTRAFRRLNLRVFHVPQRRWREGDLDGWRHPCPSQLEADRAAAFAEGSWGGEWHPDLTPRAGDVVVREHWGQSGFANTDLDFLLKQHRIERLLLAGLPANTSVETTARFAVELGYHVTLVTDATAAVSREAMRAAHEINGPTYAHAIVTTAAAIAALKGPGPHANAWS